MKMPNVGEIYELKTPVGLSYLQFIGEVKNCGAFFRVLDGIFDTCPSEEELVRLTEKPERFSVSFPFIGARRQGLARRITTLPVPERFATLSPMINDQRDITGTFHIVFPSGEPSLIIREELTETQKEYPETGTPAADLLGERIASGWRPRDWYERKRWK